MDRTTRTPCFKGKPTEISNTVDPYSGSVQDSLCEEKTIPETPEPGNWEFKKRYYGNKFSIIGDSISTYEGYNPKGYKVFYDENTSLKADILSVADTWWDKIISFFGGYLLVNNSWSGSRVTILPGRNCEELFPSACSSERTSNLHQGDIMPDVIIVNMGLNDWGNGVPLDELTGFALPEMFYGSFTYAYKELISNIKRNYPNSEIWCCTLCETYIPGNPSFKFPHEYAGVHIEKYNDAIREIAKENQCLLVDLYKHHVPYASLDGTHPTKDGMCVIANMIIREVGKADAYIDTHPDVIPVNFADNRLEMCRQSDGSTQSTYGNVIKVGRNPDCKLRINASSVSRHHATFFFEWGSWYLRDEYSTNKTCLNGITIQPGKKYKLHIGDNLSFGGENYCLFKSYSNTHDYEEHDRLVVGGTYYECKRCGFSISAHSIQMQEIDGWEPLVKEPPCRDRKYSFCACGRIKGNGTYGSCAYYSIRQKCPECNQLVEGHHSCGICGAVTETVTENEPQKEKRKITQSHILAWCIFGILGVIAVAGICNLIFGA